MFAEVVLSKASRGIDKIFHYSIPGELTGKLRIGHQVLIPFGRRNDIGYVIGFTDKAEVSNVKDIISITSECPLFTEKQVELAKWIADYYYSFFITALRLVMPAGIKRTEVRGQREVKRKKIAASTTPDLPAGFSVVGVKQELTPDQKNAFDLIKSAVDENRPEKILLYGVTGSGKTEVYLQAIEHVLSIGKSAIVLVPEIGLTPQLIQRFRDRFQDHIAVLHSGFTLKQRNEEWLRLSAGQASIVLGTRSAIFAPVSNLGLIVIDEEYEVTYKQEKNPRYHVREVAFRLAQLNQASVVMGSATPSIETYYHAQQGDYKKLVLPKRIDDRPLPPVEIVDMREGKGAVLSPRLREELKQTLSRGEQAILFINRRGFFTFVTCRECGFVVECPKCSIALTYHSGDKKLRCNRCGYSSNPFLICPRCNSKELVYFGTGTQRIEKEVAQVFPNARILRYDRDAVSKKGSHEVFFAAFAQGKADVLIGTQMVTKGLDVASVTLIGVVSADTSLHLPDFRAAEHTFQQLTQVAGRAGRHHLPGKVIIQTYTPKHYAIQAAANHDYEGFFRQEIEDRKELAYPPFSRLISILISGADRAKVVNLSDNLGELLQERLGQRVLGPAPAQIPKLRGLWRYHILLKGKDLDNMRKATAQILENLEIPDKIRVSVDVDPMSML
jgi:primosomal protein N' (replication factor Y)